MTGSLDGLLVIALEQAVAAPLCSSRLADAGARVIKIERPEGDFARDYDHVVHGESAYFVWLNRGKESITLDLKTTEDQALAARMVAKADIFIQNLMPGAAARLGFGSDDLRRRHRGLITCDISGYGEDGPYRDMKAYDLLVQGESGLASVTGTPEDAGRVGVSVCDIAAGLYAHGAILEALVRRQGTGVGAGEGAGLHVSLFDGMADWMTVPLLHLEHGGAPPPRAGLHHPSIAPYGAYKAGDGEIMICIQNPREWPRFCADVLGRGELAIDPRYADNPARVANRAALDREIGACFAGLKIDELITRLDGAGIAYGRLNGVEGLAGHPQLRRVTVDTPSGPVDLVAPPASWRDGEPRALEQGVLEGVFVDGEAEAGGVGDLDDTGFRAGRVYEDGLAHRDHAEMPFHQPAIGHARHHVHVEQGPAAAIGDRQVEGLGQVGGLAGLGEAAAIAHIGLQDIDRLEVDQLAQAPAVAFHLPRRQGNLGGMAQIGQRPGVVLR